jgi:hypothetical protein
VGEKLLESNCGKAGFRPKLEKVNVERQVCSFARRVFRIFYLTFLVLFHCVFVCFNLVEMVLRNL